MSGDLGIAIQTEKLTVALFRSIEIGDVYGNTKGGEYEMAFHKPKESTRDADNDLVMPIETSLLRHGTFTMVTPQPKILDEVARRGKFRARVGRFDRTCSGALHDRL